MTDKDRIGYNGWSVSLKSAQMIYYTLGFLGALFLGTKAYFDITSNQALTLYRINQIEKKQELRNSAIESLVARINQADKERGQIATKIDSIMEALKRGGG